MYSDNTQIFHHIPEHAHVYQANWTFMDWPCSVLFASPHQWTPLHQAAYGGHVDAVTYLVQKGANIDSKDDDGVSE